MSKLIITLIFGLFSVFGFSQNTKQIKPEAEIFLNKEMVKKAGIKTDLINSFACTQSGFLLIASPNQFYILGVGGMGEFGSVSKNNFSNFALTDDGRLMIVGNTTLFEMDTTGYFKKVISLPNANMGIFANNLAVYLYEQYSNKNNDYAIFILLKNKQYVQLLKSSKPINTLFADKNIVFYSIGNKIYKADIKTKNVEGVYELQDSKETVISITKDFYNDVIYFSSETAVYQIANNEIKFVSNEFGGKLLCDKEGLLIFNKKNMFILRLQKNILNFKN